jgi:hypothetical protein
MFGMIVASVQGIMRTKSRSFERPLLRMTLERTLAFVLTLLPIACGKSCPDSVEPITCTVTDDASGVRVEEYTYVFPGVVANDKCTYRTFGFRFISPDGTVYELRWYGASESNSATYGWGTQEPGEGAKIAALFPDLVAVHNYNDPNSIGVSVEYGPGRNHTVNFLGGLFVGPVLGQESFEMHCEQRDADPPKIGGHDTN